MAYPRTRAPRGSSAWEKIVHHGWAVTESGCWVWQHAHNKTGYGITSEFGGRAITVHRASFERHHRTLLPGEIVMHTCDNPPCLNPEHLRAGTHVENTADMIAKRRHGNAAFTERKAQAVRLLHEDGMTMTEIAWRLGVDIMTVSREVHRERKAAF